MTRDDKGQLVMHPDSIPDEVVKHGKGLPCVDYKLRLEGKSNIESNDKEAFKWDWNEHVFVLKGKQSLQQVVDHFNGLIKDEKGKTFTVEEVTEHEGKVYFPIKTGDSWSEKIVQALITGILNHNNLSITALFFQHGMSNNASTVKIEPESYLGKWILNSVSFKMATSEIKKQIMEKVRKGEPLVGGFSFSPTLTAIEEEWSKVFDMQQIGAIGSMKWKAIPEQENGVYELILFDDFNFEKANRFLPLELATSLGRYADFTPYRTELRIKLNTKE